MAPKRRERSPKREEGSIGKIPPGWIVKSDVQTNGSTKMSYYCPGSGQHFYTYSDLICYIKYAIKKRASIYGRDKFEDADYNMTMHIIEQFDYHVDAREPNTHVSQSKSTCSSSKSMHPTNISHNPIPVQFDIILEDEVLSFMHRYIEKAFDVEGDGHCGFRAVAALLDMSVDDHHTIRRELLQELTSDHDRYFRLIGTENRFKEVKHALTHDGIDPASDDKWMIMPDMGFLIAQKYKCVVVLLSIKNGQAETLFPLRGAPSERDRIICLAHVNDNHFMMVYLKDDCPIPPAPELWKQRRQDDAEAWESKYIHRIHRYNELSRATGNKIIGDDDVIVENIEKEEKVVDDNKVEDEVKVEDI